MDSDGPSRTMIHHGGQLSAGIQRPIPEPQALGEHGSQALLEIARACVRSVEAGDLSKHIKELFEIISGHGANNRSIMFEDSVENLIDRCYQSERNAAIYDFIHMLDCIQLRNKLWGYVTF